MEEFNLLCGLMAGNYHVGYETYYVQCDDMYCYAVVTSDPSWLWKWIVELFFVKQPSHDKRLRVSMDIIWDQHFDDDDNTETPVTFQFCHDLCCIIYQVYPHDNFPRSALQHFLSHNCVDFVGLRMPEIVQYLFTEWNLEVSNWFDINENPKGKGSDNVNEFSLQMMVLNEFSKWYSKPARDISESCWRFRKLPPHKVLYVTLDCFFAYKLAVRYSIPPTIKVKEVKNLKKDR